MPSLDEELAFLVSYTNPNHSSGENKKFPRVASSVDIDY